MNEKIIKKGSMEWWYHIALREATGHKKNEVIVIVSLEQINRCLGNLNRNPLKRLWSLLTIGDIRDIRTTDISGNDSAKEAKDGNRTS